MARVAVVGATGLIGGAVARALVARGDEVVAVSRRGASGVAGAGTCDGIRRGFRRRRTR